MRKRRTRAKRDVFGPRPRELPSTVAHASVTAPGGRVKHAKLFELVPSESGKRYRVKGAFTVHNGKGKSLTIPDAYENDRYSVVPDLPDARPAVVHDYACDPDPVTGSGRKWDDGTPITFREANDIFFLLMRQSADSKTRRKARTYYNGARFLGWPFWLMGSLGGAIQGVFEEFKP